MRKGTIYPMQDIHNKLKNGVDVEEVQNLESASLGSGERIAIV